MHNDLYHFLESGYKNQKEAKQEMKKYGYDYDSQLSNNESKVFLKNGKPTIVHRGSKRVKDWLVDDALIFLGLEGKAAPIFNYLGHPLRSTKAKEITKKVEEKYKTSADTVGHSLGGRLAENSGAHGNITTYNKAVGLADIGTKKNSERQLDIRNSGDIVSVLGHTQKANKHQISSGMSFFNPIKAHDLTHLINPHAKHS